MTKLSIYAFSKYCFGAEISLGHHYDMAVEIALVIPPGNSRVAKGILSPLTERYGARPEYSSKLAENYQAWIYDTRELDLVNERRSGRLLLLTSTKAAALRTIN